MTKERDRRMAENNKRSTEVIKQRGERKGGIKVQRRFSAIRRMLSESVPKKTT